VATKSRAFELYIRCREPLEGVRFSPAALFFLSIKYAEIYLFAVKTKEKFK